MSSGPHGGSTKSEKICLMQQVLKSCIFASKVNKTSARYTNCVKSCTCVRRMPRGRSRRGKPRAAANTLQTRCMFSFLCPPKKRYVTAIHCQTCSRESAGHFKTLALWLACLALPLPRRYRRAPWSPPDNFQTTAGAFKGSKISPASSSGSASDSSQTCQTSIPGPLFQQVSTCHLLLAWQPAAGGGHLHPPVAAVTREGNIE